tara:strand:+ start:8 stop:631 length:624 start_codon:yes stop_codon:yes gene_type:complete
MKKNNYPAQRAKRRVYKNKDEMKKAHNIMSRDWKRLNYLKRIESNRRWKERNPEKYQAIRVRYENSLPGFMRSLFRRIRQTHQKDPRWKDEPFTLTFKKLWDHLHSQIAELGGLICSFEGKPMTHRRYTNIKPNYGWVPTNLSAHRLNNELGYNDVKNITFVMFRINNRIHATYLSDMKKTFERIELNKKQVFVAGPPIERHYIKDQ